MYFDHNNLAETSKKIQQYQKSATITHNLKYSNKTIMSFKSTSHEGIQGLPPTAPPPQKKIIKTKKLSKCRVQHQKNPNPVSKRATPEKTLAVLISLTV